MDIYFDDSLVTLTRLVKDFLALLGYYRDMPDEILDYLSKKIMARCQGSAPPVIKGCGIQAVMASKSDVSELLNSYFLGFGSLCSSRVES